MDIGALLWFVIVVVVIGVVFWLILYIVDSSPIPEPFKGVLHWVVIAIGIVFLIYLLLGLISGGGPMMLNRPFLPFRR